MGFHNRILLIGIASAVIPLLIYLLTRDKIAIVPFSTLRFFAGTSAKLVKRKRWLETLLLILRAGLCALLAFAFARPFLTNNGGGDPNKHVGNATVLAIDVSQSMSRPGLWKQAIDQAHKSLDQLPSGSAIALIAFDQAPRVEQSWSDAQHISDKLDALQPSSAGTDLAAAAKKADELLADIPADAKQLIVVSDLQRSGWANAEAGWKLHPGVSLVVDAVTPDHASPVALVDASYPQDLVNDHLPHAVALRLANTTDKPAADVTVQLAFAGKKPESQKVTIPPNQQITTFFRPVFDDVGDHPATITVTANGDSTPAATFNFNAHVQPRIDVALIAADEDANRLGSAAFFMAKAIRPSDDSAFDVKTYPASAASAEIEQASVIIVCDVAAPSPALRDSIAKVLHRGGGLLLVPGEHTQPQAFADAFTGVAPCQLRRIISANETRKGGAKALITRVDLDHPIFEIFQRPHSGDFSNVQISRYWEVTDSQLARVPMRLDDGRPFMLEAPVKDGGNSILLVSPPDLSWNNFPQRAIFLPLIQQTLRYLALCGETPTTYQVGDLLPIPAGDTLQDPSGKTQNGVSFTAAGVGTYTVLDAAGKPAFIYAVNTPLSEADATMIPADEFRGSLISTVKDSSAGGGNFAGVATMGREFWMYLIILSLTLVVVELYVANRVPRH